VQFLPQNVLETVRSLIEGAYSTPPDHLLDSRGSATGKEKVEKRREGRNGEGGVVPHPKQKLTVPQFLVADINDVDLSKFASLH